MKGRAEDGLQLPMSLMYFVREVDQPEPGCQVPDGWFEKLNRAADLPMVSLWPNGPWGRAIKMKVSPFDSTETESLTRAELRGRRRMMSVLDYYQRVEGRPWHFDRASPIIGIREGRRVRGEYVLTEEDVRAGRRFEDGVAVGTFYIDAHEPTTEARVPMIENPDERRVPDYYIPLRALRARGGRNLWMAGRCLSSDQMALASARVSTSCAMMGQAAGVAAALAACQGREAAQVDPGEVQRILCGRGARLELDPKTSH
jgi:hypothetical protein